VIFYPITPAPPLARFVATIFHLKDYQPEQAIERVVPDTLSSLVIELDGQERWVADNETQRPIRQCRHSWISGPHRNYFSISARPNTELLAVQFNVGGLFPLVRRSVEELTERVVDAIELLGASVESLRTDLMKADASENKVRVAEAWLLEQLDTSLVPPRGIQQAIDKIQNDPSLETVTSCIADAGVSQKHAIHLFKKHTGYRPKELQRIIRFSRTVAAIQNGESVAWAALSAACGYADQAHFIRDFKHFSGFTPTRFQQVDTDRVNFIPIDEPGK
jgi:AraC-like DNA-binding protein